MYKERTHRHVLSLGTGSSTSINANISTVNNVPVTLLIRRVIDKLFIKMSIMFFITIIKKMYLASLARVRTV